MWIITMQDKKATGLSSGPSPFISLQVKLPREQEWSTSVDRMPSKNRRQKQMNMELLTELRQKKDVHR